MIAGGGPRHLLADGRLLQLELGGGHLQQNGQFLARHFQRRLIDALHVLHLHQLLDILDLVDDALGELAVARLQGRMERELVHGFDAFDVLVHVIE
jgi:hypothetical protein